LSEATRLFHSGRLHCCQCYTAGAGADVAGAPDGVRALWNSHAQLTDASNVSWVRRFFAELRELGYAESVNLTVERYSAEGRSERFASLATDIVARQPDLIVANGNRLVRALQKATGTIPIVAIIADPIGSGIVSNLARPGGNITGVSADAGIEIYGKRLQILKEAVPAIEAITYLGLSGDWQGQVGQAMREAARSLQLETSSIALVEVTAASLRAAFADIASKPNNAVVVSGAGDFLAHRQLIVDLVGNSVLSAMYPYRDYVEAGGLMTYAPELGDLARQLARTALQILQGAKAGDLPIYQATKFELIINLKTAKALGVTVPPSLLARADEVIE
jgi:putative ABC transport system substrate-binding protein